MAVIAFTDRGGIRSWLDRGVNGVTPWWSENKADAEEFADNAAVLAFLAGKDPSTIANGQLQTIAAGTKNYGKKEH